MWRRDAARTSKEGVKSIFAWHCLHSRVPLVPFLAGDYKRRAQAAQAEKMENQKIFENRGTNMGKSTH
ncbi:MAG: hypothetical protein D6743_00320, partial [Calditrichaeota bacterium]